MTIHEHFKAAEIDTMPAGREMDALVAEYVMGWIGYSTNEKGEYNLSVPNFSTDIAAAWQVMEKIKETWAWFGCGILESGTHWAAFDKVNLDENETCEYESADAATIPLAICRASLKAVID